MSGTLAAGHNPSFFLDLLPFYGSALHEFDSFLAYFLLLFTRFMPVIAGAPFLGGKAPTMVSVGLGLALAYISMPYALVHSHVILGLNPHFFILLFKEFFIGMLISFFTLLPFYTAETSGILIDFSRGASSLQVNDPYLMAQSSDIGILFNYAFVVTFFTVGGFPLFLEALWGTLLWMPVDQPMTSLFFTNQPVWRAVVEAAGQLWELSVQLAAPSLISILMADIFLGIANRLAPQVQISFLGQSLKSLAGIGALAISWMIIIRQMELKQVVWIEQLMRLFN